MEREKLTCVLYLCTCMFDWDQCFFALWLMESGVFSVTVRWFHRVKARKTATNDDVEGGGVAILSLQTGSFGVGGAWGKNYWQECRQVCERDVHWDLPCQTWLVNFSNWSFIFFSRLGLFPAPLLLSKPTAHNVQETTTEILSLKSSALSAFSYAWKSGCLVLLQHQFIFMMKHVPTCFLKVKQMAWLPSNLALAWENQLVTVIDRYIIPILYNKYRVEIRAARCLNSVRVGPDSSLPSP